MSFVLGIKHETFLEKRGKKQAMETNRKSPQLSRKMIPMYLSGCSTGKCKSRPLLYTTHKKRQAGRSCKFLTKVCFNTCIVTATALSKEWCLPLPSAVTDWRRHGMPDSGICSSKAHLLAQPSPWRVQACPTCQRILSAQLSESDTHLKGVIQIQGIRKVGFTCLGCCCC